MENNGFQDESIKYLFQKYLKPDENIIWTGKPVSKYFIGNYIIIIAELIFFGFILYNMRVFFNFQDHQEPIIFKIFPLFFVVAFIIPFFVITVIIPLKRIKKLNKRCYAITNKRILELSTDLDSIKESDISSLSSINTKVGTDGYGTVVFGLSGVAPMRYMSELYSLKIGDQANSNKVLALINIPDSQNVCDTIRNISGKPLDPNQSNISFYGHVEEKMDINDNPVQPAQEETYFPQSTVPRQVPINLGIMLTIGSTVSQFGWLFFGIGLIIFWIFGAHADYSQLQFNRGYTTAWGIIKNIEDTGITTGDEKFSLNILKYSFEFTDLRGVKVSSESYRAGEMPMKIGQMVLVEYLPNNSSIARIRGMQRKTGDLSGLISVIFPLIGLVIIFGATYSGFKKIGLLRNGTLASAELKSMTKISESVRGSNTPVVIYNLAFEYTSTYGTKHTVNQCTHNPEALRDQKFEPLIYNPSKPTSAVLLDALPGCPRIDNNGEIILKEPKKNSYSILSLILPALVILGHGYYAYITFIK